MFAMRLLELEQKFESYCTIHEQELTEFKALLDQLREDIVSSDPDRTAVSSPKSYNVKASLFTPKDSEREE